MTLFSLPERLFVDIYCRRVLRKVFTDTGDHWGKEAIITAVAHEIVSGYSKTVFAPNDPIIREQMALIVVKAGFRGGNRL
ncbi:S-layer homology domain-containing protein [Syntrophomonas erecta]